MGSNKVGARKNGKFRAVCTAPSFNKTPVGPSTPPIPYPVCQDLSNSVGTVPTVNFNGDPAYVLDQSSQPMCMGDAAGSIGGVKSGTVSGEVKPTNGSTTVKATKKPVVRENDPCTLNGGNCPGLYLTQPEPSGSITNGTPSSSSGPPFAPETAKEAQAAKEEKGFGGKLWDGTKEVGNQIWNHPKDAALGFAKDVGNIPSNLAEMFAKGNTMQVASEMEDSAMWMEVFGQSDRAEQMWQDAEAVRSSVNEIEVPKFHMDNPAQQAGATVSMVVQLALAAYGLVAGGVRLLSGAARVTAAEGEVLNSAAKGGQLLEEGGAIADANKGVAVAEESVPAKGTTSGDGVRITPTRLRRPYIRKAVRAEVEARAPRTADGRPIDPNTGEPIDGTPDLGHKPGHEFWREQLKAEEEGLTQQEFNDRMNNPDLYQLEDPSSNRSHLFEQH